MRILGLVLPLLLLARPTLAKDSTVPVHPECKPVPNSYIVIFNDSDEARRTPPGDLSVRLTAAYGGQARYIYRAGLRGYSVEQLDRESARALARDPSVAYVEQNCESQLTSTQLNAPWGLDRIDQRDNTLTNRYHYTTTGAGVHAYVVDSGLLSTHQEFTDRVGNGASFVMDANGTEDCNGHGTHVSGILAGTKYGVAKGAIVHPVRAYDCNGHSSNDIVLAALTWIVENRIRPAVANLSLMVTDSPSITTQVNNLIAGGTTVVVSSGLNEMDSCGSDLPRISSAIAVGSSTANDDRSPNSPYGSCTDLFAPGFSIESAWIASNTDTKTLNGTSQATPHVAGFAARYLQSFPNASPATVSQAIVTNATTGRLSNLGTGSPNRLLFSAFVGNCQPGTTTLCLQQNRFRVRASIDGTTGRAVPFSDLGGYFWAFGSTNLEVGVKILDGSSVNTNYWLYHGAATDLPYNLTVTDTYSGSVKTYHKGSGSLCGGTDVQAFGRSLALPLTDGLGDESPEYGTLLELEDLPVTATRVACSPSATNLCLHNDRFAVQVRRNGTPQAGVEVTSETGSFSFFSGDNPEVFVKVLDGTPVNGRYWVFFGSMTDQTYTVQVTDTDTGTTRSYNSPAPSCGTADVNAF